MKSGITIGLAFSIISGAFMTWGAYTALSIDERIRDCQSVSVRVLSSTMQTSYDTHSRPSYTPVISYQYEVTGKTYENNAYMPYYDGRGSKSWVSSVVDDYKPGKSYTGFFMPAHPQDSFLVKEHTREPYALWLLPSMTFVLGIIFILYDLKKVVPKNAPSRTFPGWFTVNPYLHQSQRVSITLLGLVLWCVLVAAGIIHYFIVSERPYDWEMYAATVTCSAIALYATYHWVRYAGSLVYLEEPQLVVESQRAVQGQVMRVKIGLHARFRAFINKLSIGLVLRSEVSTDNGRESSDHAHGVQQLAADLWLQPGKILWIESTVEFPENCTPTNSGQYNSDDWFIQVKVTMFGRTDEELMFPIEVDEKPESIDASDENDSTDQDDSTNQNDSTHQHDLTDQNDGASDITQEADSSSVVDAEIDPEMEVQEEHRRHAAMLDRIDRLADE